MDAVRQVLENQGQLASAVPNRARNQALDFLDSVSHNICSYLVALEEQQGTVVYDSASVVENGRWQKCVENIVASSSCSAEGLGNSCPHSGSDEEINADGNAHLCAALGICPPPKDVAFAFPQGVPQGNCSRLMFSSCFESGNLAMVRQDSLTRFTLLLDFDVNTVGYTQWFFFGVTGGFRGLQVTFIIANMAKADSLFASAGMRPVVWSEASGCGWVRGCSNVQYGPLVHRISASLTLRLLSKRQNFRPHVCMHFSSWGHCTHTLLRRPSLVAIAHLK